MALPSLWRSGRGKEVLLPSREAREPFSPLRRDMERLFEDFSRNFGGAAPALRTGMAPQIDVSETDAGVTIEAELPGVDEKDVEVVLSDGRLTIKGEKKQETEEKKKDYHVVERTYGSFARLIARPFMADPDKVKARFLKGVLTVTVPKPPEVKAKEKKIAISQG
jgi:HSP20 family protein